MRATDQMIARYAGEIDERQKFMDGLVETAEKTGRDLDEKEMELIRSTKERIGTLSGLLEPLTDARRIADESETRLSQIANYMRDGNGEKPRAVEYRSAGEYVMDRWRADLGNIEAKQRIEIYHRAAAHQTTADNAGLIPTPILDPVVSFIDTNRTLVARLG